jgi:hypothetical protein
MIDTVGVEERCSAYDAMHLVALVQQQFGEIAAVLSCNTSYNAFLLTKFLHLFGLNLCHFTWQILNVRVVALHSL